MLSDDPEAPTTINAALRLRPAHRRRVPVETGSVVARPPGSIEDALDPTPRPPDERAAAVSAARGAARPPGVELPASWTPSARRPATRSAVMGPQLGYYYPEIVQQIHLHGPGIEAQGAAVPGLAMYMLIGRTQDYAWSLTSAGHDVRDVFAEQLCEPDGSTPTRDSDALRLQGRVPPVRAVQRRHAERHPDQLPRSRCTAR